MTTALVEGPLELVETGHHWQWVVARPDGANVAELTEARTRRLEFALDGAAQATWTMPGRHPQTKLLTELSTDLAVARDRRLLFRGRIGGSDDTLSPTVHTSTFAAVDYRGMLDRRIIWPGSRTNFANIDQTHIVRALVIDTQALGDLGISYDPVVHGVARDRTYEVGQSIGELIGNLGRCIDGFEWDVSPELLLRFFYPRRGNPVPVILAYGRDLSEVRRTVTSTAFASAVRYSGAEIDGVPLAVTRQAAPGPEGRFERQDGNPDVIQLPTLNEQADGAFAVASTIRPSYQVTLKAGVWDPQRMWLGDAVRLLVRSGRLDVDTVLRIMALGVELNENELETVRLELGARPPSLVERLSDTNARLDRLERR
jgi:hypothetical protein